MTGLDLTGFAGKAMSSVAGLFDNKAGGSAAPGIMEKGMTALGVGAVAGLADAAMGGNNNSPLSVGAIAAVACFAADTMTGGAISKGVGSLVKGAASMIGMGASAKATP